MNSDEFYTTGEFAKKAGVTIRTIRYYDSKGILKPSYTNNLGYRYYSDEDFIKLKKNLSFKVLGIILR
ncbi:MerR family transcriptional regulator [Clostridium sulfidigenes]|uniref:MerR family transcriptional regulator n=1 Tax=Clostridium sulfidigenes TaxID=318464 RepID=UPI00068AF424|nr:MerR family transcriptional regulator [Clostridium sulfidigenes]